MGRILYVSTKFEHAAGGVRMIFHHVRELRRLGHEAFVVATGGDPSPRWFAADAPILPGDLAARESDVLVLPEVGRNILAIARSAPCRKVLFCQNHFQAFTGLQELPGWTEAGVDSAMYCSRVTAEMVERCFAFRNSAVIRCGIDHGLFHPAEARKPCVVLMPRKRPGDVPLIRRIFERQWPTLAQYPWYALSGRGEQDIAAAFGRAAVFLSLSYREGLGLPPLEAMAAGCLVAGFTGHGGRDYATAENGFWAEEDDVYGAADALGRALSTFLEQPERTAALRAAGQATAARYSFDAMREDLRAFWGRITS